MDHEIISTRIQELLETITEQIGTLREYKGKIPQIEFDLVLQNVRELYQELHVLQRLNDPYEYAVHPAPVKPPVPPPAQEQESLADPVILHVEKPKSSARKETKEKHPDQDTVPDLFGGEQPTFNIRLQEAREQSLGPKPPHADHLKALISINDKFIFINELFDGNLREYNETIETLNGFMDRRQAFDFFDLVRNKNLWDPSTTAFKKLQEVLERKFG